MTAADGALTGFAPAKVNLTLHLQGQREDGYHLMSSLVVFPEIGDHISVVAADGISLSVSGPGAQALDQGRNLVLDAADALSRTIAADAQDIRTPDSKTPDLITPGASLRLVKTLPVAAGIGGGSSDAATTLRLLARLWDVDVPPDLPARLGADVPVCTRAPVPQIMEGIGDVLRPAPPLPPSAILLANPGVAVPTGEVFAKVPDRHPPDGAPMPEAGFSGFVDLVAWLRRCRNDLQGAALDIAPPIGEVLSALSPAAVSRMSGSGATCWALFPNLQEAEALARSVRLRAPGWWVETAWVNRP